MAEIKVVLKQNDQNIGVNINQTTQKLNTSVSTCGMAFVSHDETLTGRGTIADKLGIADPILKKINTYIFDMAVASDLWTIVHNLDKYPSVSVVDSGGNIVCGIVRYIDKNSLTIEFNGAFTGKAYLN